LQVGGPVTAGNGWLDDFTAYCKRKDVPFDFVSTHYYPTDPFGAIDSDTITQLEHSPPGVMRQRASEARAVAGTLPLYYTEWSISSNPRDPFHDSSFAAALATRIVMSVDDVVDGYSYWTFTDIFEENYFPSAPFHGGFGMMNLYGVPKPIYRAMQMLRALGDRQIDVTGEHATVAVWVGAGTEASPSSRVVLINQALPRHPIAAEQVTLRLSHASGRKPRAVTLKRIDAEHANPERAWHEMGAPAYPSQAQVAALVSASEVASEPVPFEAGESVLTVRLTLAPQSVNQLDIQWMDA
ncbi:MAG: beta-xylosidase, partial [Casimicrobiaceae bacterium]